MNTRLRTGIVDVAALLCLFVLLQLPARVDWINAQSLVFLPIELLLAGLLLLVPGKGGRVLRVGLSVLLALGLIFKIGDLVVFQIFSRAFNPVFDLYLIDDGLRVVSGAFGHGHAILLALALVLVFAIVLLLAFVLLGGVQRLLRQRPRWSASTLGALLVVWVVLKLVGFARVNSYFSDELVQHVQDIADNIADIRDFKSTVNNDVYANADAKRLFNILRGKDVLVVFVEAYGRTVFDDPAHAAEIVPLLEDADKQLGINGLYSRSAWLTSPTVGGLSWLAHGTLLSGLWIDNQTRYDTLLMSQRPTLNTLFQRAGWRTVGVMPQITQPWPEGRYFGFDQLYPASEMGYKGLPFGWISMPDQYTLAMFQAKERSAEPHRDVMAEIVLVSSHTPWAPLPELLRWSEVDDGPAFNAQTTAGPDVDAVWEDADKIREQYRHSIAYDMNTLASYAINYGGDKLVMLVVGDHQPLPVASNNSEVREVPVHVITGDKAVIDAMADWHWSEGLVPATAAPVWRMDQLRDRFIQAFSQP